MKKIIGLVLIIITLAGGIFAGMQLSPKKEDKKETEIDFQKKQFLYSKFNKPIIIPIFKNDKAIGMLIAEIWLELEPQTDTVLVTSKEPRLRDELMQVFYLYASEGRLSQSLLEPKTQAELRRDLTHVAKKIIGEPLHAVLINDMQRQDLL